MGGWRLQRAGSIPDPYWNVTWRNPEYVQKWANGTWSFERHFDYDQPPGPQPLRLCDIHCLL